MKDADSRKFFHRLNADNTIDSICLSCFLTAARVENKADLHEREAAHKCDNKDLFILSENLRILHRSVERSANTACEWSP
jgi:hypothetical protein